MYSTDIDVGESEGPLMETLTSAVTIEKALELAGYGKYTILLTLACGLCLCGATSEIYIIGFVLPAAECDLNLDTGSKSLLAGAGTAGMILSANLWGFLSDRYGRKRIIVVAGAGGVFCSLIALFSQSFWPFVIFRCLSGAFITGSLTTLFAYFGEFVPHQYRSSSIVLLGILQNFSSIYITAIAWFILPLSYSFSIFGYVYRTWRICLFLNAIPLLLGTLAICFFPESPKFLLSNGDMDGTIDSLKAIYFGNNKRKSVEYQVKRILVEPSDLSKRGGNSFFDIFNKQNLSSILSTSFLQFGNFAVSSGWLIWYSDILNIQNDDNKDLTVCEGIQAGKDGSTSCEDTLNPSMFTQNLWIGLMYIAGQLLIILALKYTKKTSLQGIFTAVSALSAAIMTFVKSSVAINVLFVLFLVLPGLCVVIVNALIVDFFPTHLRSSALSFSLTMGRISTLVTTSMVGYLIKLNCHVTFLIYAGCMISCAVVAVLIRSKDRPNLHKT